MDNQVKKTQVELAQENMEAVLSRKGKLVMRFKEGTVLRGHDGVEYRVHDDGSFRKVPVGSQITEENFRNRPKP